MTTNMLGFFVLWLVLNLSCGHQLKNEISEKVPDLFHYDDYDNCMRTFNERALYCLTSFELTPNNLNNVSSGTWKIIQQRNENKRNYRHDILVHGICVPETCPNSNSSLDLSAQLSSCYQEKMEKFGLTANVSEHFCQRLESAHKSRTYDFYFWCSTAIYLGCTLLSTILNDVFKIKNKYSESLSLVKSWQTLTSHQEGYLKCIQGVRVYSAVTVILYHVYIYRMVFPVSNPEFNENWLDGFIPKFMEDCAYIMLLCFMLSSWMLTNTFIKLSQNLGEIRLLDLITLLYNRYTRLIPSLMIVIGLMSTSFVVNFMRGVNTELTVSDQYRNCRRSWWMHLLIFPMASSYDEMCMVEVWYLKNDTTFYLYTLAVLMFWKFTGLLNSLLAALVLYGATQTFSIYYENSWPYFNTLGARDLLLLHSIRRPVSSLLYTHFGMITYIPAWAAGIFYGFHLAYRKDKNIGNGKVYLCGFLAVIAIILIPPFLLDEGNRFGHALLASTAPIVVTFGSGLFIYGMTQKYGGIIRRFSESSIVQFLGKISFGSYLINLNVIRVNLGSQKELYHLSYTNLIFEFIVCAVIAYFLAFLLTWIFEIPISNLLKWKARVVKADNRSKR